MSKANILIAAALVAWISPFEWANGRGDCGSERWSVKTLMDRDRHKVSFTPISTTVRQLAELPIPEIPYPDDGRIAPNEFTTYRAHAFLVEIRHEKDQDLHLILADPANSHATIVAEVPAPQCARGSGHEEEFRTARALLSSFSLPAMVEVTGVGFWDYIHPSAVRGAAKNGFELHPVLRIETVRQ